METLAIGVGTKRIGPISPTNPRGTERRGTTKNLPVFEEVTLSVGVKETREPKIVKTKGNRLEMQVPKKKNCRDGGMVKMPRANPTKHTKTTKRKSPIHRNPAPQKNGGGKKSRKN